MKRTTVFLLPFLVFGCAVEATDEVPTEPTTEEVQTLDGTELSAAPELSAPSLVYPSMEGQAEMTEPGRPDPDPWFAPASDEDDPNRPDPDPWGAPTATSTSGTKK